MQTYSCDYCGNKAKMIKRYYNNIKYYSVNCQKCQHRWLPHNEEMKIDAALKEDALKQEEVDKKFNEFCKKEV